MSSSNFNPNNFKAEVSEVCKKIIATIACTSGFGDIPVESVVYALLKTAAALAVRGECPKDTFENMAQVAYNNELVLSMEKNEEEAKEKEYFN